MSDERPEPKFEVGDKVVFDPDSQTYQDYGLTEDDVFVVTDREYIEGSKAPMAAAFGNAYDRWSYGLESDLLDDMSGDEDELEAA